MRADDPYGGEGGPSLFGWAFRQLAIWGGLGFLLYAGVVNRAWLQPAQPHQAPAAQTATASQPGQSSQGSANSLVYHADKRGHFSVDAAVNGAPMHFMVDTGASAVVLTMADAAAAGYGRGNLAFSVVVSTANGHARAAPIKLREVRIGQLAVDDVPALVAENLDGSLLGMSFLRRLDGFEMRDGVLTITWN
jgi:aspartyl protease family protein